MNAWRGDAAIFDCDGTLVNVQSIRHHVILGHPDNRGYKDFEAFHEASVWCPPILTTVQAVEEAYMAGLGVLVLTARAERWRGHTHGWYESHVPVPYDALLMRPDGDFRADHLVKADMLTRLRADGWNPVAAWDDNPSIVELWRSHGIPCTVVPGWMD